MFCLMLLLFGAVVFISGTDPKKLKDFNMRICNQLLLNSL